MEQEEEQEQEEQEEQEEQLGRGQRSSGKRKMYAMTDEEHETALVRFHDVGRRIVFRQARPAIR